MWGAMIVVIAVIFYVGALVAAALQALGGFDRFLSRPLVWVSGGPLLIGLALIGFDAIVLAPRRRGGRELFDEPLSEGAETSMTVVLTAYNDEESIGQAVDDFMAHPFVRRVLVIDNNSSDRTFEVAKSHGAIVHRELLPGYGRCVYRALRESSQYSSTPSWSPCVKAI